MTHGIETMTQRNCITIVRDRETVQPATVFMKLFYSEQNHSVAFSKMDTCNAAFPDKTAVLANGTDCVLAAQTLPKKFESFLSNAIFRVHNNNIVLAKYHKPTNNEWLAHD